MPVRCSAPGLSRQSTPERVAFGTVPVPFGNVLKDSSLRAKRILSGSICNRGRERGKEMKNASTNLADRKSPDAS